MFRLLRFVVSLVVLGCFLWFGFTVKLGEHTFFGHLRRIWSSDETQDLVEGTRRTTGPAVDRMKRGLERGYEEATRDAALRPDAKKVP